MKRYFLLVCLFIFVCSSIFASGFGFEDYEVPDYSQSSMTLHFNPALRLVSGNYENAYED